MTVLPINFIGMLDVDYLVELPVCAKNLCFLILMLMIMFLNFDNDDIDHSTSWLHTVIDNMIHNWTLLPVSMFLEKQNL